MNVRALAGLHYKRMKVRGRAAVMSASNGMMSGIHVREYAMRRAGSRGASS